jgi:hypothetical protein
MVDDEAPQKQTRVNGVTSQKAVMLIVTILKTSDFMFFTVKRVSVFLQEKTLDMSSFGFSM